MIEYKGKQIDLMIFDSVKHFSTELCNLIDVEYTKVDILSFEENDIVVIYVAIDTSPTAILNEMDYIYYLLFNEEPTNNDHFIIADMIHSKIIEKLIKNS